MKIEVAQGSAGIREVLLVVDEPKAKVMLVDTEAKHIGFFGAKRREDFSLEIGIGAARYPSEVPATIRVLELPPTGPGAWEVECVTQYHEALIFLWLVRDIKSFPEDSAVLWTSAPEAAGRAE